MIRVQTAIVLLLGMLALAGCQVTDPAGQVPASQDPADAAQDPPALGSPDEQWPRTLPALRAFARPEAATWQDEPVLADLVVWLTADGVWERVRLTYVAAEAERMLTFRSDPENLRLDRPRLAGLQLPELPTIATEQIELFPDGALEPLQLAEAAEVALADCGAAGESARAVLYATGAPAAWDGTTWTRSPTWRATVVTESIGAVVDPETGQAFAPLSCVDPVLLSTE